MPLLMFFSETGSNLEILAEKVNRQLLRTGRCIVVVNEGLDLGNLGARYDGFGHIEYAASENTAMQTVINYLNKVGLKARGQATGQLPGVLQRSTSIHASTVDIEEAYKLGVKAVELAMKDGTGYMSTILREPGDIYKPYYDKVPLELVANSVRHLPSTWISEEGTDVTDDFLRYARPLIGDTWPEIPMKNGLQRFARFERRFIEKKLNQYIPVGMR